jgi:hypothetical protein
VGESKEDQGELHDVHHPTADSSLRLPCDVRVVFNSTTNASRVVFNFGLNPSAIFGRVAPPGVPRTWCSLVQALGALHSGRQTPACRQEARSSSLLSPEDALYRPTHLHVVSHFFTGPSPWWSINKKIKTTPKQNREKNARPINFLFFFV